MKHRRAAAQQRKYLYHKSWIASHPEYNKKALQRYDEKYPGHRSEYGKVWHTGHPTYGRLHRRKQVAKTRSFLLGLKMHGKCVDCTESDFRILERAHKKAGSKTIDISTQHSLKRVKRELLLCVFLCRNCHKRRDFKELLRRAADRKNINSGKYPDKSMIYQRKKIFLDGIKKAGCRACGKLEYCTLEFAHKYEGTKKIHISAAHSWKKILQELKVCIVLCANCHGRWGYANARRRAKLRMSTRLT